MLVPEKVFVACDSVLDLQDASEVCPEAADTIAEPGATTSEEETEPQQPKGQVLIQRKLSLHIPGFKRRSAVGPVEDHPMMSFVVQNCEELPVTRRWYSVALGVMPCGLQMPILLARPEILAPTERTFCLGARHGKDSVGTGKGVCAPWHYRESLQCAGQSLHCAAQRRENCTTTESTEPTCFQRPPGSRNRGSRN